MKLIVCVDDMGGILFNRRRVSSDQLVIADLIGYVGESKLFASEYSRKLFPTGEKVALLSDFSAVAVDDYVFLEDDLPQSVWEQVREVVVYHWNRLYPSDVRFPIE